MQNNLVGWKFSSEIIDYLLFFQAVEISKSISVIRYYKDKGRFILSFNHQPTSLAAYISPMRNKRSDYLLNLGNLSIPLLKEELVRN